MLQCDVNTWRTHPAAGDSWRMANRAFPGSFLIFTGPGCAQVVGQRLMKLDTKSAVAGAPAEVIIRRLKKSRNSSGQVTESWEMIRARGHLTEVQNLRGACDLLVCMYKVSYCTVAMPLP